MIFAETSKKHSLFCEKSDRLVLQAISLWSSLSQKESLEKSYLNFRNSVGMWNI